MQGIYPARRSDIWAVEKVAEHEIASQCTPSLLCSLISSDSVKCRNIAHNNTILLSLSRYQRQHGCRARKPVHRRTEGREVTRAPDLKVTARPVWSSWSPIETPFKYIHPLSLFNNNSNVWSDELYNYVQSCRLLGQLSDILKEGLICLMYAQIISLLQ